MRKNFRFFRRKNLLKVLSCLVCYTLVAAQTVPVMATTSSSELNKQKKEAEQEKKNTQSKLDSVESELSDLNESKEEIEEELWEIDAEFVDLILSIDILEGDITDKNTEIENAQAEYDQAVATEEEQREAMKRRIRFMYEKGDASYLSLMLQSQSMAELVNKVDYTEKLYDYDRRLLNNYQEAKQAVFDRKSELETDLSELEEIEENLQEQKLSLQSMILEKKELLDNFDEKMTAARAQADSYKSQIKAQSDTIKKIEQAEAQKKAEEEAQRKAEEEAKRKAEEEAKKAQTKITQSPMDQNNTESSGQSESTETQETQETQSAPADPGNSGLGAEIASYAAQFVGNPYVAGGTSLTDGCDCSGFTQSVYAHFGISIPRSSYSQSAAGREVSYTDIQPGDILYYGGHVAIYYGNNTIVHASTAATGIKFSNASYRTVITIRRFV